MRRAPLVLAAGCALVLLPGCAEFRAAPLSPTQSAAAFEGRSLADPHLQQFIAAELDPKASEAPASDPPWDLARLTLAALYYHPDLDIARARLAGADAALVTAGQRPNPMLNLAAVFGTAAVAGTITAGAAPVTIGPVIDLVIESAGKRQYRTARARHLAEAAREGLATAAWQVRGRVRDGLIGLWAAQRRIDLTLARLRQQEELVGLLENRLAAGAASALDVARERIGRAQLRLAVRDAERAAADARARLATAVGVPLAALDGIRLSFAAFDRPPPLPTDWALGALRRQALTERSDIKTALAEYAAAQSALRLAVAGQYPNVTVGPGYEYDFGVNKYLLGPSLPLPLFNRNEGPIAEAAAARREAAARFIALQARIIGAIDNAAADYRTASMAVATADNLVGDAERRAAQMRHSFAAGGIDRPALVSAELERTAAALSGLDAVVRQRRALGRVEDALQRPLFDKTAPILAPVQGPRPTEPDA